MVLLSLVQATSNGLPILRCVMRFTAWNVGDGSQRVKEISSLDVEGNVSSWTEVGDKYQVSQNRIPTVLDKSLTVGRSLMSSMKGESSSRIMAAILSHALSGESSSSTSPLLPRRSSNRSVGMKGYTLGERGAIMSVDLWLVVMYLWLWFSNMGMKGIGATCTCSSVSVSRLEAAGCCGFVCFTAASSAAIWSQRILKFTTFGLSRLLFISCASTISNMPEKKSSSLSSKLSTYSSSSSTSETTELESSSSCCCSSTSSSPSSNETTELESSSSCCCSSTSSCCCSHEYF
jgi:hypothetical protein